MNFHDAHNHLQDERFRGLQDELLTTCKSNDVASMVVNGACESDWPEVLNLAHQFGKASKLPDRTKVIPSFGCHPWYLHERTTDWLKNLTSYLDKIPCAVGEIGLDRWKPDLPYDGQEEAFLVQLNIATERNLPVSIHCLKTWGRLHELLCDNSPPACGFVLHSFSGPAEMIPVFAKLGAYFSFPGYFLHERKTRQREAFRQVPADRLLIETDAPDQHLPEDKIQHSLLAADGKPLNHPANLPAVYSGLSEWLGEPLESLASRVEENFLRLFGTF